MSKKDFNQAAQVPKVLKGVDVKDLLGQQPLSALPSTPSLDGAKPVPMPIPEKSEGISDLLHRGPGIIQDGKIVPRPVDPKNLKHPIDDGTAPKYEKLRM